MEETDADKDCRLTPSDGKVRSGPAAEHLRQGAVQPTRGQFGLWLLDPANLRYWIGLVQAAGVDWSRINGSISMSISV